MEIEHIPGIGLPAWGTLQQQGQRPVGHRVFGQVVVHNEHIPALAHEIFAQGAAGVGGDILQGRGRPGGGADHAGVLHGAPAGKVFHQLGHRAGLLPDGHVDTHHVFALLVEDGVHGHGGFARLPVADDKLPLAPSDGEHGVNGQKARFHGGVDGLAVQDAGGGGFDGAAALGAQAALAVDGLAQGVHHPAQELVPHGHPSGFQGAAHHGPRADGLAVPEQDAAQSLRAEILHHAPDAGGEDKDLAVLGVLQPGDGGDLAVHGEDGADLLGDSGQLPVVHRLPHQGEEIVLPRLDLPQVVGELPHPAVEGPVVHIGANLEPEAAFQGGVLLPVEGDGAVVGVVEEHLKPVELIPGGTGGTAQLRAEAASTGSHGSRLPLPGLKTGRRGPRGGPAAWRRSPPDGEYPAGSRRGPAPWCAPRRRGHG